MSPSAAQPDNSERPQDTVRTCTACGRLLIPGQAVCACGTAAPSHLQTRRQAFDFGKILPYIPLIGALILLYLVINPTLVIYTIMPALKIAAITFLASAAIALIASDRASKQDWLYAASPFSGLNPPSWFAGVFLVWPVFYPAFLYSHYKIINRRRMIFGFITGLLFIIALLWILLVSRKRLPEWPVQPKPSATTTSIPAPAVIQQAPLETTPAPTSFPVMAPPVIGPATTAPEGMISPFPAATGNSGQGDSPSNGSSLPPSSAPAPVPRQGTTQPGSGPDNNSGNPIPLLSVEIIRRGTAQ